MNHSLMIDREARKSNTRPTDGQKEAGNYQKGHVRLHGLDIAIENPKGSMRRGTEASTGQKWAAKLPSHYGYIKRTEGADGDHVDVYIGPKPASEHVFVVDQKDARTGKFDEHKVMLGYQNAAQALRDYCLAFSDGRADDRIGNVTSMTIAEFKNWLRDGDTTGPMKATNSYARGGAVFADGGNVDAGDDWTNVPDDHPVSGVPSAGVGDEPSPSDHALAPAVDKNGAATQELTQGDPNAPKINMEREAGFLPRFYSGLKLTPEGRANALESDRGVMPGPGTRVVTDKSGKAFIFDPEKKEYYPVDKPGFSMGDIADLSGDVAEAAPTLLAPEGRVGKPLLSVDTLKHIPGVAAVDAGLGAIGGLTRYGLASMVPGDENISNEDLAKRIAGDAAVNTAGSGIVRGLARGLDTIRPHNIGGKFLDKTLSETDVTGNPINPNVTAGNILEDQIPGLQLTPGQKSGSRFLLSAEGFLRRHPVTSDTVFANDKKQLDAILTNLNGTLDGLSAGSVSPDVAGAKIQGAYSQALNKVVNARRTAANADFNEAERLGGPGVKIPMDNTYKAIDDLISEFDAPGGGDAAAAIVNRLKSVQGEIGQSGVGVNPNQMNRLLQIYGNAAKGSGSIIKDVDTAQNRYIAGKVSRALQDDLGQAVDTNPTTSAAAQSLKKARDNYRLNSQSIDDLTDTVLGRALDLKYTPTPERIAEKLYSMKPSEVRQTFNIVQGVDPETANVVKRHMLEAALSKAELAPSKRTIGGPRYSSSKIIDGLEGSPVLEVLSPADRARVATASQALERLTDRAGTDGSPTQILSMLERIVTNPKAMGVASAGAAYYGTGDEKTALAAGTLGLTPALAARKMAKLLLDPAAVQSMRILKSTAPSTKAYARAATYLGALMGTNDNSVPTRPDATLNALQQPHGVEDWQ